MIKGSLLLSAATGPDSIDLDKSSIIKSESGPVAGALYCPQLVLSTQL